MDQVCWIQSWGVSSLCSPVLWFPGWLISLNTERCWFMTAQAQVHSSWKSGVESRWSVFVEWGQVKARKCSWPVADYIGKHWDICVLWILELAWCQTKPSRVYYFWLWAVLQWLCCYWNEDDTKNSLDTFVALCLNLLSSWTWTVSASMTWTVDNPGNPHKVQIKKTVT